MVKSLLIKNFRGFESVSLRDLRRVNIIVGGNASGKTSFLEAVLLPMADSPAVALRYKSDRGLADFLQFRPTRRNYEDLWRDLFFGLDQDRIIQIALDGDAELSRSVTIAYSKGALSLPLGGPIESAGVVPIEFTWVGPDKQEHRRQLTLSETGINLGAPVPHTVLAGYYSTAYRYTGKDSADAFSSLSKRNEESYIVDVIREGFPFVRNLSVETYAGEPAVYAQIKGVAEKIPIAMVSEGISRLLNILLGIATCKHSFVLVDEIENGIYFDRMPHVWSAIFQACLDNDCQLFATTHSNECLNALTNAIPRHEDEFSLLRTEREDGRCVVKRFKGSQLLSAIRQHEEVR